MSCSYAVIVVVTAVTASVAAIAVLYYYGIQASQRNELMKKQREAYSSVLQEDPEFPGVVFPQEAKYEHVTSAGKEINLEEELGLSISIPENSFDQTGDINLTIATSFSGPFTMPDNVDSVSPIFFVRMGNEAEFSKDVEVKIQHNAYIESEEDFGRLVLLKGSTVPDDGGSDGARLQYKLEVVEGAKIEMVPGEPNYALVKMKGFSCFGLGREGETRKVYSARLYKEFTGAHVDAVFCMCQQLQSYLKHCDEIIKKEYGMTAQGKGLTVYKGLSITADAIELDPVETDSWKINMDRPHIPKVEIDDISSSSLFSAFTAMFVGEQPIPYDYPPRIFLQLVPLGEDNSRAMITARGLDPACVFWVDKVVEGQKSVDCCECQDDHVEVNGVCHEKSEIVEPTISPTVVTPCQEIRDINSLFDQLADMMGDWQLLCSRLGVQQGTIQALQYPSEASYKLYSCLRALMDLGPPHSCWERVAATVCKTPLFKKRLGRTIAEEYKIEVPSECL